MHMPNKRSPGPRAHLASGARDKDPVRAAAHVRRHVAAEPSEVQGLRGARRERGYRGREDAAQPRCRKSR